MGRHHSRRGQRRGTYLLAAAAVVVLGVGVGAVVIRSGDAANGVRTNPNASSATTGTRAGATSRSAATGSGAVPSARCASRPAVRVAVSTGFAPVLKAVAAASCVDLTTTEVDSGAGAALLSSGQVDVWIADSRERAYLAGPAQAAAAPSVAVSPIVMSANSAIAAGIESQSPTPGRLTWAALLDASKLSPLTLQIQDPTTSSVGLVLAGPLSQLAAAAAGDPSLGLAATAQALGSIPTVTSAQAAEPSTGLTLRITEERLVRPHPSEPAPADTIISTVEGSPTLDYPWVAGAGASGPDAAGAQELLTALLATPGHSARSAHGFRDPGITSFNDGTVTEPLLAHTATANVPTLYAITTGSNEPSNVLAVIDVSGSMGYLVDGGRTVIQVAADSVQTMLPMLPSDTTLALWKFGSRINGALDYETVIPSAPISSEQAALAGLRTTLKSQRTGTGLYNTTLAAYKAMLADWKPGASNIIAVFTDGRNEDAPGLDLTGLLAQLKPLVNPAKPVGVLLFGYGDADITALRTIATATGGAVFPISKPSEMIGAMIAANAQAAVASQR